MISTALFIYTETSLHAGVGSTVSIVDLPIQRERTTLFPIVQGSGIKGALRSQVANIEGKKEDIASVFGADTVADDKFAGAVSVGDARIVLFPVRSLTGVFAYVTCPAVLARIGRDIAAFPKWSATIDEDKAKVNNDSKVTASSKVVLEEFSFASEKDKTVDEISKWLATHALPQGEEYSYWRQKLQDSLVILHDDAFRDFVQNSTEIVTRVRLDSATKTVAEGALWTQEMLPSDTLLMSNVIVRSSRNEKSQRSAEDLIKWLHNSANIPSRIQIGGDETTGQGFVALRWSTGA